MSDVQNKKNIISMFAQSEGDTGSASVQVALLSDRIKSLTNHCKDNPKDFSTRRGLLMLVCKRRRFLQYLAKKNINEYQKVIGSLGLKR